MTKVLLVEDDNNLREIYEARLQAEGYTIVSARDGEEALVVAKAEKPDLIISDIMMPKISGFEMLDILRNTDELKAVKIIMLTALGQSDDQQRADKLGADRYLVKSQVTLEDIVRVAHELLSDNTGEPPAVANADSTSPASSTPIPAAAPAVETEQTPTETVAAPNPTPSDEPVSQTASDSPTPSTQINVSADEPDGSANGATSSAGMDITADETPSANPITDSTTTDTTPTDSPAPSEPAISSDTDSAKPESTAQEEAQLEAQIEDFVAGAEEQPNIASAPVETPASDSNPAETEAAETPTEPAANPDAESTEPTLPETETPAIVEDQASGAPSLSPSEKAEAETAAEAADAQLVDSVVKTLEDNSSEKPGDSATAEDAEPASTAEKKGGERVIQPLESEPKTDINELLAKEEAQNQASTPDAVISPNPGQNSDNGIGPAKISSPPPTAPGQVDPNSIAL